MDQTPKDKDALVSYTVRDGTIDYGKDYEVKICALLSLRGAGNKIIQNTWILVNADRCGAFDDLVFCVETKDGRNLTYLIQLKHGMDSSDIPAREFKSKTNGKYYLQKYYQTILEIKTAIDNEKDNDSEIINYLRTHQDEMVFILFTNRGTTDCNFLHSINKKTTHDTKWFLYQFIDTGGSISKLICDTLNLKIAEGLRNIMEEQFFVFTKQIHIEKIDSAIETAIENLIKPVKLTKRILTEVTQKFILFVTDWCKGELGGHYPLSRNYVFRVLFEHTIQPYMIKFEEPMTTEAFDFKIWNEMIEDKSIIPIEEDDVVVKFINGFVYEKINQYREDLKNINQWKKHPGEIRKQILRFTGRSKQIRICDAYECLWKSGKVPLILKSKSMEDFNNILNLIKVCEHKHHVIVLKNHEVSNFKFPKSLSGLKDLNQNLRNEILNLPVRLQGRLSIKLFDFVVDDMLHLINVKDLIYILTNNYNVGNNYEALQEMFIGRSLEKVWIEAEVFQEVTEEMFLVKCKSVEDFKVLLERKNVFIDSSRIVSCQNRIDDKVRIVIFEDGRSVKQMEVFGITRSKITHLLMVHENNIEWLKSFGSIKSIAEFRAENQGSSSINQILKDVPNRVNLISAPPGMGKSMFLNYLSLNASTDWWVIKINLLDYVDYYKSNSFENEPSKNLNYFADKILGAQNSELVNIIFKKYSSSRKIMVLLDAYDEIPVTSQNIAKQMIKSICQSNYCTFLTTRPIYQGELEELLNTFGVNIKMFSGQDQKTYLMSCFSKIDQTEAASFSSLLLEAAKENLNDSDQEFTGIPLQTKLLAEVFTEDYIRFCVTKRFDNKRFDLLYLYERFMNAKITIFCSKFGNSSEDLLVQYKSYRTLYALRLLFTNEDLDELKIDEKLGQVSKLFPNTLQIIQKDGIVVVQKEKVTFVHRTFAEYLSAEWLAENINSEFKSIAKTLALKIFDPTFSVVRNIFDRILAKDCPFHLAIISHRRSEAKVILDSNPDSSQTLDRGGRNFLHMIAAWGLHHPATIKTDKDVKTIKELILKDVVYEILHLVPSIDTANRTDSLLEHTPLDYAVFTRSLHIADYICSRTIYNNADSFFKNDNLDFIFDCVVKMSYFSLVPTISRHSVLKLLQHTFYLQGTIAQQLGTSYLRRLAVTGTITDLNLLANTESNINEVDSIGCTILHAAVMYGRVIMTNVLLTKGADPNVKDSNGYTPLHWATIKGYGNIIHLLISKKVNVDEVASNGRTALHLAVFVAENKDRNEIVSILLENKASIVVQDNHGKSPLHYCVEFKQLEILKLLLQSEECTSSILSEVFKSHDGSGTALLHNMARLGFKEGLKLFLPYNPDLEIKEIHGRTVLHVAACEGQTNIVNLIVSQANIHAIDNSLMTALHVASWNGHTNTVKALLTHGAMLELKDEFNRTPLICAAQNGHEEITNVLLEAGANLEAKGERDRTTLTAAARSGYIDMVTFLISKGANIEAVNDENMSALHFAAWAGHDNITRLLLSKGANFDQIDIYGRSPLICAITGRLESIDMFLNKEVDIEIKDNEGMTALSWACWFGQTQNVQLLLQKGANFEVRDNLTHTPLIRAAYYDHTDIVAILISKGADLEARGQEESTALYCAAWNGATSTVEFLLTQGANVEAVNNLGTTPLMGAARNGHEKIVNLLLTYQSNIHAKNGEDMTALHWAAWNGHTEIVDLLLSKEADLNTPNIYQRSPLLSAAAHGHASTVELLLSNGANIEATDDEMMTALHCAATGGHYETVNLLISKGANVEAKDQGETTPLHFASYEGHTKTICVLLKNNCNINASDDVQMTSLHWATHKSHIKAAELLITMGANLEAKNKDGKTPLLYVSENGNLDGVKFLLTHGADIEAQDANNRTAFHLAIIEDHQDIVNTLLTHGANLETQDLFGNTGLIYSARLGYLTLLKLLLSKGANIKATNNNTETALHWGVWNGHHEVAELLISQGANLEAKDQDGQAPLIGAAIIGDNDMVNLLLSNGADIETNDNQGKGVLHCAVIKNIPSMVEFLLLKSTLIEAKDVDGKTALLWAVIEGHAALVNLLLSNGADIETRDDEGMGALHWAAWNGHQDLIEQFTQNLENANVYGRTALACAAQRGQIDAVKLLLSKGACFETKDNEDKSLLHWATINGHLEVVKFLLSQERIILNSKDKFGKTSLAYASSVGNLEILTELLSHGADFETVDYEEKTPLHCAALNGCTEAVELLLDKGTNLEGTDFKNQTALILAAQEGHLDTVTLLMSKGANIDKINNTGMNALLAALDNGHVEVTTLLLEKGADKEAKDNWKFSVLHYAALKGYSDIVTFLLSNDVALNEIDDHNNTPLIYAIAGGQTSIAISLLLKGAAIDIEANVGVTPLQLAASLGHKDVVETLLSKGVEIEHKDGQGRTALIQAARFGHLEVVNLLLSQRANIEAKDNEEATALIWASSEGHKEVVNLLLANGANVKAISKYGTNPLISAAQKGHEDVVALLLDSGLDVKLNDNNGLSALDWARKNDHEGIAMLIEAHQNGLKDNCVIC